VGTRVRVTNRGSICQRLCRATSGALGFAGLPCPAPARRRWPAGLHAARFFLLAACATLGSGCFFLFDPFTQCEPDAAIWISTLTSPNASDYGRALAEASNGDLIIAGHTAAPASLLDIRLMRVDAAGNLKWSRTFGSEAENEQTVRVAVMPNRDLLVLAAIGHAYDTLGRADYLLVRTDVSGVARWERRFGGDRNDVPAAMVLLPEGPLVLGTTESTGAGGFDLQLIQMDFDGNETWSRTYGGAADDEAIGLVATGDGGFALLGTSASFGDGRDALYLVKTDALGEVQWYETYGPLGGRVARAFQPAPDGGFVVAGHENNTPFLMKVDASGDPIWERELPVEIFRTVEALAPAGDGGYYLTGTDYNFCGSTAHVTRTDANGNIRWMRTYAPLFGTTVGYDVIVARNGDCVLAGDSDSYDFESGFERPAIYLVRVDSDG